MARTNDSPAPYAESGLRKAVWLYRGLLYTGLAVAAATGGPIIAPIAIGAAAFALWGDLDGLVRHSIRIATFAGVILIAPLFGTAIGDAIVGPTGMSVFVARVAGIVVVGAATLIIGGAIGRKLSRNARRRPIAGAFDRTAGSLVGCAEGALLVLVFFWSLSMMQEPLTKMQRQSNGQTNPAAARVIRTLGELQMTFEEDPAGRKLAAANPFESLPALRSMRNMTRIASDPDSWAEVLDDRTISALLQDPAIYNHLEVIRKDPELMEAVENRNIVKLMSSEAFMNMLSDRKVYKAIVGRWDGITEAINTNAEQAQYSMRPDESAVN